MLNLYAQTFMIATRTDMPLRSDTVAHGSRRQPMGAIRRPAGDPARDLPHLGLAQGHARNAPR